MRRADLLEKDPPPHPRPRLLELGNRLSKRMEELGLSGAELARHANISPRQLNHYLHGRRSPDVVTAKKLTTLLHMTLDDLVDPQGYLSHRDDRVYAALRRFYEWCTELEPADVGMVADLAEILAVRRRQEARGINYGKISPVSERLTRVHHRLIPAIIERFPDARLETDVLGLDGKNLWVAIALAFDKEADRTKVLRDLLAMAVQRVGVNEQQVQPRATHPKIVSIAVCLGSDPREEASPKKSPKKKRGGRSRRFKRM